MPVAPAPPAVLRSAAIGKNNLNSGGNSSSVYSLSEKYILLILQLAWICTLNKQRLARRQRCKHPPERLNVVGSVRPPGEVRQVELDLVPALVESHGHGADEGLDSCRALWV